MCGANLLIVGLLLRMCPRGGDVVRGRRTEGPIGSARRGGGELVSDRSEWLGAGHPLTRPLGSPAARLRNGGRAGPDAAVLGSRVRMPRPARPPDLPIRSQLVGPVLAYVRARGGDVERLLRVFSLSPGAEADPEVTVPLSSLQALFDDAEREARDPFLGLNGHRHALGRLVPLLAPPAGLARERSIIATWTRLVRAAWLRPSARFVLPARRSLRGRARCGGRPA
ncbi:AraC family transcriptional regulator ligand-binding domain-containing protein [Sorangium sp. So ce233]|uniref:AraC family transcriptional regulator ligand-binding domain-containing protein n=1 Tax=Sorangium sp. So ce233 TaxID=3133290 RepID=UPI003F61837D